MIPAIFVHAHLFDWIILALLVLGPLAGFVAGAVWATRRARRLPGASR